MFHRILSPKKEFGDPAVNPTATEFEVNKWTVSEFVVDKLVPVVGIHPFPLDELMLMTATVCRFKPLMILEWGTHIGKSARIFYEITEAFRINAEIHSIDLPDDASHVEHPKQDRGRFVRGIRNVALHQGDGLERSFELIAQRKPSGKVLFFVDGDHSYESVKRELEAILERHPDAVVLLHDTFYQSEDSGYNIGPYQAIKEVLASRSSAHKWLSTNLGLPGMSLVHR